MIARWQFRAKFGYKRDAIDMVKKWYREIGSEIGWPLERVRIITGSVGAPESLVECEIEVKDMKELEESWAKLAKIKKHDAWGKHLEKYIVSGSSKWELFRVISD